MACAIRYSIKILGIILLCSSFGILHVTLAYAEQACGTTQDYYPTIAEYSTSGWSCEECTQALVSKIAVEGAFFDGCDICSAVDPHGDPADFQCITNIDEFSIPQVNCVDVPHATPDPDYEGPHTLDIDIPTIMVTRTNCSVTTDSQTRIDIQCLSCFMSFDE